MKTVKITGLILLFAFTAGISFAQQTSGNITGHVIDKASKEPLPGVNVILVGTVLGAATDADGYFRIADVPFGNYQVKVSAIGFDPITKTDVVVNSARPTDLKFELIEAVIELQGVTVKAGYFDNSATELSSTASFSYEEIRRAPGGFEDVVRALSILPGVGVASQGRNDLIVRGGAPSENLFVVDGIVVPNINHFGNQGATGGPLSYINLDFVRETTFSTGGFSAVYGDKLSSVLNIELRDGRSDKIGGKATVSASQFGLNVEGPLGKSANFIFSARRSYLDFIFNAAGFNFVPEYYDVLSKLSYEIDTHNKLSYLFVSAFDRVKFNNKTQDDVYDNARILGSNQNQYFTGITFRHLFDKGFYNITLSRNFVDYDSSQRDTLLNPIFMNKSREGENELKFDAVTKLSSGSELNFGASAKLIKFSADVKLPDYRTTFGEVLNITSLNTARHFTKYSLFAQYTNTMFGRLKLSAGLRGDYFNEIETKFYASPRFALSYFIDDESSINLSTGIYYQSPSYIWLTAVESNKNLKAVKVDQYVLGYERKLMTDTRFKAEAFYKNYGDYPSSILRPYIVLANTGAGYTGTDDNFASFGLEPLVSAGKGNSKGVEFSVQKKSSDTPSYGILSLTYSQSFFTGLDGIERPGSYDQKWIFNFTGGYIFSNNWEASFKFRFATGSPYTPFNSDGTQSVSKYNSERMPAYHSLDVRVDRRWNFEKWNLIAYVDIQNIYNRKNISGVRWDYKTKSADMSSSIGILPSIGVSLEF